MRNPARRPLNPNAPGIARGHTHMRECEHWDHSRRAGPEVFPLRKLKL